MNNQQRAEFACKIVKEESEKKYYFGQAMFNHQFTMLTRIAKETYMQERFDWRNK